MSIELKPEADFTESERKLYELMSEISEDCWCAGWMTGNEFALWEAIVEGDLKYGQSEMDRQLLAQVAALSVETGKWIIWRDADDGLDPHDSSEWGPYAISLADWKQARAATQPAPIPAQTGTDEAASDDGISPAYAYLQRIGRCGIPEVEDAARTMMAFYQGAEFPEPAESSAGTALTYGVKDVAPCTTEAQEVLADVFQNSERPDKITIALDRVSHSVTVTYADMDEEWFAELDAAIASHIKAGQAGKEE